MAKNKIRPRKVSRDEPSRNDETDEGTSKEGEIMRYTNSKGRKQDREGTEKETMNIQK